MKTTKTIETFLLRDEMERELVELDFRMKGKVVYPVGLILLSALAGVMMGASTWNDIAYIASLRSNILLKFYPEVKQTPSHDTLRRFFSLVSTEALERVYRNWAHSCLRDVFTPPEAVRDERSRREQILDPIKPNGKHVALDGKTIRGAMGKSGSAKHLKIHILSAFSVDQGICLGQMKMPDKSGEITNLPLLIKELNIGKGDVVTVDAIGAQTKVVKAIREKEADYVIPVKSNQPSTLKAIKEAIESDMLHKRLRNDEAEESEDSHGRSVRRWCFLCAEKHCLGKVARKWPGVCSFGVIRTERTVKSTGETSVENHYFISSLGRNANFIMHYKREHWRIENNLHWRLDVQYGEDDDRKKLNSAQNFSLINKMVMTILKLEGTKETQGRKRLCAAANPEFLEKIIHLFIS
ncbi:MAG: ISAs1 family transposase, partial [Candidatus Cryptobacteroides sp.]